MNERKNEAGLDEEKNPQEQPEEDSRRISPSLLRIMVVLYIFWIVQKLVVGIVRQDTDGTSPWFLGAAAAVLLIGAAGLIYLEWRDRKKR